MVGNIWSLVNLYCANNHQSPSQMTLMPIGKKFYYTCPLCKNKITVQQFEKALDVVSDELTEGAMNNSEVNLMNFSWKKNFLSFHIFNFENEKIDIEVLNREEIR